MRIVSLAKSLKNKAKRLWQVSKEIPVQIESRKTLQILPWYQPNYWEPTVTLAMRDLCLPGDVVFDVGANTGALSVIMSRLVGPRGVVCSFEASPRIVDKTQYNLVVNGCSNVQVYQKAIFRKSNEILTLWAGTDLNDTLHEKYSAGGETFKARKIFRSATLTI